MSKPTEILQGFEPTDEQMAAASRKQMSRVTSVPVMDCSLQQVIDRLLVLQKNVGKAMVSTDDGYRQQVVDIQFTYIALESDVELRNRLYKENKREYHQRRQQVFREGASRRKNEQIKEQIDNLLIAQQNIAQKIAKLQSQVVTQVDSSNVESASTNVDNDIVA